MEESKHDYKDDRVGHSSHIEESKEQAVKKICNLKRSTSGTIGRITNEIREGPGRIEVEKNS